MAIILQWKKLTATVLGAAMLTATAELPAGTCDYSWACWVGGALLGAAAGAGTGYAAGHRHGKTGRRGQRGEEGKRGDRGPIGDPGFDGTAGTDGVAGMDGENGLPGTSGCNCPSVDTQTRLFLEATTLFDGPAPCVANTVAWNVTLFDPQRDIFMTNPVLMLGGPGQTFEIPAGQEKLTGTYLILWTVTANANAFTQLGDVIFNGTVFSTPGDVWMSGDQFKQYVQFP